MWKKPITSVPADDEANLRAGRPTVKKNISVPHTTAVLRMPTRDTGHIQWFIVPPGVRAARESGIALSIKCFILITYSADRLYARRFEKKFHRLPSGAIVA